MTTELQLAATPEYWNGCSYQELQEMEDYQEMLRAAEDEERRFWDNLNMSREEHAMEEYDNWSAQQNLPF